MDAAGGHIAPRVEHMVPVFLKADYSDGLWQELQQCHTLFKGSLAEWKSADVAVEQHLEGLRSQAWRLFSLCSDTNTQQSPSGASSCKPSSLGKRVEQQGKPQRWIPATPFLSIKWTGQEEHSSASNLSWTRWWETDTSRNRWHFKGTFKDNLQLQ